MLHVHFYLFIAENALSLVAFVTGITDMSFERESITTCGNNKFETNFSQNFSKIFKSVSVTGFKTSHTAFTCSKKSSMLYLFQRVIRNRCKIDTNRASLTNWGKLLQIAATPVVTNRGNSYYKSGPFHLLQIGAKLLQIGAVITNRCRAKVIFETLSQQELCALFKAIRSSKTPGTRIFSILFKNAKGWFKMFGNFLGPTVYPLGEAVKLNMEAWYWNFKRLSWSSHIGTL